MKKEVLILFGGCSSEYDVSLKSASAIICNLRKDFHHFHLIGITKDGKWIYSHATPQEIADDTWSNRIDNARAFLSPDREQHGIIVNQNGRMWEQHIDCVWPVLHGKNGEDGTIQGLCDLAGIPCVGPGLLSSAVCMDKATTKLLVAPTKVRQADYVLVRFHEFMMTPDKVVTYIQKQLQRFPLFVKPCASGSSVGVSKVHSEDDLIYAIQIAGKYDNKILVEEAITGQEIEVAVLGNYQPITSLPGEIIAGNEFYDYNAKYENINSKTLIPANLSEMEIKVIREAAAQIYKALDCKGLSRVDFFLTEDKEIVFNEINTLPGFTSISMYPKLWEATGIGYSDLLDQILSYTMD